MATIRKRQLKNGGNGYKVQVKIKEKSSGEKILEKKNWRPDGEMTAKQEERAVQNFLEEFECPIKTTGKGAPSTNETPSPNSTILVVPFQEKLHTFPQEIPAPRLSLAPSPRQAVHVL